GGYAWITRKQINWYVETAAKIEKENGRKLPALAFFHIPIPEYDQVFDANSLGSKNEVVCCSKINSGFFAAMLEAGDIMGTFVGHDHTSDYEGTLNGIRLCYGRGIGYSTYGKDGFPRGAKVIVLTEDKKDFQTWVRAEGGQKIDYQKEKQAACQSDK
ncbi:MAG TPA: metallophosphoesterase family protein, partial [Sedimentisphaerales bacterium]|nr:metallophosphoesterase family protein [Sedimentisphaerales bacterium]